MAATCPGRSAHENPHLSDATFASAASGVEFLPQPQKFRVWGGAVLVPPHKPRGEGILVPPTRHVSTPLESLREIVVDDQARHAKDRSVSRAFGDG